MSKPPPVTFAGYVSEAGGKIMQEWFDALPYDVKDEIRDTVNHLSAIPVTEWKRPQADKVRPPLIEIRGKTSGHEIRIYGVFDDEVRARYILLNGNEAKKKGYDGQAQELALKRLGLIKSGKASTHEFAFEKRTTGTNPQRQEQSRKTGVLEFRQGGRLPDTRNKK